MQTTAIACLFYLGGLMFSLSIVNIDDRISQYDPEKSPWEDDAVSIWNRGLADYTVSTFH